jgi:hypothetical protein
MSIEETYYVSQIILVGVLVAVTIYYAVQTHRQANLLKRQLDETRYIRNIATIRQSIEQIDEWAQYGINEYCIPRLGRFGRDEYPVSVKNTTHLILSGGRALGNASYIGGDLWDKVKQTYDFMARLFESIRSDTELSLLTDSEHELHLKDFQKSLGVLSEQFSEVITLCRDLRVEVDRETSK